MRSWIGLGAAGLGAGARLATVLWVVLLAQGLLFVVPLIVLLQPLDRSPLDQTVLEGWDAWPVLAFGILHRLELGVLGAVLLGALAVGTALELFLVGGLTRLVASPRPGPVTARLLRESVALFPAGAGCAARFAVRAGAGLALVAACSSIASSFLPEDRRPNTPADLLLEQLTIAAAAAVLLLSLARLQTARAALARGDAWDARRAYRVAGQKLQGRRLSAVLVLSLWLVLGALVQGGFTLAGVELNPGTGAGMAGLFVFRQAGFWLLAFTRTTFWASFLAWYDAGPPARPGW